MRIQGPQVIGSFNMSHRNIIKPCENTYPISSSRFDLVFFQNQGLMLRIFSINMVKNIGLLHQTHKQVLAKWVYKLHIPPKLLLSQ